MEEFQKRNESKGMFATVNRLTKQACLTVKLVRDKQGHILTEDPEILQRWGEYCENQYSDPENSEHETARIGGNLEPTPLLEEVEKAINAMKPGKTAGPDKIPAELGEGTVIKAMHKIIGSVWQTGKWPEDWKSTFVPIYKKGDPAVCANYRTISLISHASKLLLKIIQDRMRDKVECEVAEEQVGFRRNRGTQNHLCSLRSNHHRESTFPQTAAVPVLH